MVKNDFWLTSGWHLLDKDDEGRLLPTEDFMRAYFYRPEVAPIEESCEAEIDIHVELMLLVGIWRKSSIICILAMGEIFLNQEQRRFL